MYPDAIVIPLSRIQFGFAVSFHVILPALTIGLAAWPAVLEGLNLAFGLGVVPGIVMAFQFGSNWSGPSQGRGRRRRCGHRPVVQRAASPGSCCLSGIIPAVN